MQTSIEEQEIQVEHLMYDVFRSHRVWYKAFSFIIGKYIKRYGKSATKRFLEYYREVL